MNPNSQQDKESEDRGLSHTANVQIAGVVLTTPGILLMTILLLIPFITVIYWSFTTKSTSTFTLSNYQWLLGPNFLDALKNNLIIGIGSVIIEIVIAVPLALLLNQKIYLRGFLRSAVTLPWAIPTIAVAAATLWLANTNYGLFNQIGLATGILKAPISFLGSPIYALPTVTLIHAWKGLPLVFVIVLASLQSLPSEILEAAKVDGAWRMQQFFHIILPHLKPSIALAAVVSGIYNFALFDITYLLTGGGPAGKTTTLPLLLFFQEFYAFNTNRAAAVGILIFVIGAVAMIFPFFGPLVRKSRR